jgi:hypothetical protein
MSSQNAGDLVSAIGPDPGGKPGSAAEIDDEPRPVNSCFQAQDVDENIRRSGPIGVETCRKTA